nr:MAG TPA: hypothetical protein [Caudoviricetes sp.]DAT53007.1 MAG TPA: hypothetical protein [Caudoviricetes sp.]
MVFSAIKTPPFNQKNKGRQDFLFILSAFFIIKILSFVIGRNPPPLGGGRSLVNRYLLSIDYPYMLTFTDKYHILLLVKYQ